MQTRDQRYANEAHRRISAIKGEKGDKGYGSMAHRLPILIHTAGLAQALAFVEARGKCLQPRLLTDLAETIGFSATGSHTAAEALLARARKADFSEYILLTRQTLAALLWYKRFAQSILGVEESDMDTEEEV